MRADAKHVIIDTYRWGGYGGDARPNQSRIDFDATKESMRTRWRSVGNYQSDRLAPLERFLRKNCGRPWAKVYAEACAHADGRSVRGNHLRDHLREFVRQDCRRIGKEVYDSRGERITGYRFTPFYVDQHGLLQELPGPRSRKRRIREQREAERRARDSIQAAGGGTYRRIDGFWYYTWIVNRRERGFDAHGRPHWFEVPVEQKRRLSNKEVGYLGLDR